MNAEEPDLATKLNLETGKIGWPELQRHFARGQVYVVGPSLDLVEVAYAMVQDERSQVEQWLNERTFAQATAAHARDWQARSPQFWALVVAPWVLVQEMADPL